ncbi:MAG: enoyl-CoA hydratase-related protein [Gammaproteobacteria bacterium]
MSDAEPEVLYTAADGVAVVTLNRPAARNAMTYEMAVQLRQAMLRAQGEEAVRIVVLTGAGAAFCVGLDVNAIVSTADHGAPQRYIGALHWPLDPAMRHDYQATHNYFPGIDKPIIGMLNGATAGLGLIYAAFCDLCFAADSAVFSTSFARRAVAAEYGIAWLLPRLVGQARAADLLLSARRFDAAEALQIGLVARVYPRARLEAETMAYAQDIALNCGPLALSAIKRQLWEAPFQTLAEANMLYKRLLKTCTDSADLREAALSFLEKRPPRFTGR